MQRLRQRGKTRPWRDERHTVELHARVVDGDRRETPADPQHREASVQFTAARKDGGLSETEYEVRLAAIDERAREVIRPSHPAFDEAAELFSEMPALWDRAAPEERRRLVAPLIERVYLDIDSKRIRAITPTPEFKALIDHALEPTADPDVVVIPPESPEEVSSWRSWRRGLGDITLDGEGDSNLTENADQVDCWRWWRRGRLGLPPASVGELLLPHAPRAEWHAQLVGWQMAA